MMRKKLRALRKYCTSYRKYSQEEYCAAGKFMLKYCHGRVKIGCGNSVRAQKRKHKRTWERNMEHFEIERKFLIKRPDEAFLSSLPGARCYKISQTYLTSGGRVRRESCGGETVYTHTLKKRISDIRRIEIEDVIGESEYLAALADADPELETIEKKRWRIRAGKFVYEIDLFPFWEDEALLEVELDSENESFPMPDFLEIIREVTDDGEYTNRSIAREQRRLRGT